MEWTLLILLLPLWWAVVLAHKDLRLRKLRAMRGAREFDLALMSHSRNGWTCIGKIDSEADAHHGNSVEERMSSLLAWGSQCYPKSTLKVIKMEKP